MAGEDGSGGLGMAVSLGLDGPRGPTLPRPIMPLPPAEEKPPPPPRRPPADSPTKTHPGIVIAEFGHLVKKSSNKDALALTPEAGGVGPVQAAAGRSPSWGRTDDAENWQAGLGKDSAQARAENGGGQRRTAGVSSGASPGASPDHSGHSGSRRSVNTYKVPVVTGPQQPQSGGSATHPPESGGGGHVEDEANVERDQYGFKLTDKEFIPVYRDWVQQHQKKVEERKAKWMELFRKSPGTSYLSSDKLKKLVRKGIPDSSRGEVWMDISGASKKKAASPGLYKSLVDASASGCSPDAMAQIELDLPRTFPEHVQFRGGAETPVMLSLRRVLMAYASRNKVVGYCQGMNFIVGVMLLFVDEEKAFWLLCSLLEDILPPDYYTHDLSGCNVDLRVLKQMLLKRHAKLMKRCEEAGLGVEFFGLEWFIAIFSKTFPVETMLRVWDCIFLEGDKILFRVGLGIIEDNEKKLLAIKEPHELFQAVQGLGRTELDADNLLKVGFGLRMKRSQVEDLRQHYREEVRRERQERLAKKGAEVGNC